MSQNGADTYDTQFPMGKFDFKCLACNGKFVVEEAATWDPIENDPPCPLCHDDGTLTIWMPPEDDKVGQLLAASQQALAHIIMHSRESHGEPCSVKEV